jgi:hypothetical protein
MSPCLGLRSTRIGLPACPSIGEIPVHDCPPRANRNCQEDTPVFHNMNSPHVMKKYLTILSVSGLTLLTACNSGYDNNTTRGAAGGAAAGALIGGIIGHQSGDAAAGAAIGAVAGGVAGGAYGNNKDKKTTNYQTRDSYGFTTDDYYNLLNAQERETLRARAQGRNDVELTSYLTDEERANLRRRAAGQNQIGR